MFPNVIAGKSRRTKKEPFVWILILGVLAAIAAGDVNRRPEMPQGNETIVPTAGAGDQDLRSEALQAAGQGDVSASKKIQSITFQKDMGIRDALRFLAARYHKNIIPSANVDGVLTVGTLYDVTFDQALDAILGYGFRHEQDGNFIKVFTAQEYLQIRQDKERMIHKVFTLYYISAVEAKKLVTPVISEAGIVEASSQAEAGVSTGKEGVGSGEGGGDSMSLNDKLVIYDYPENMAKAEELIGSIDIKPKQVLVEATILSADLTENTQLGVDWSSLDGVTISSLLNVGAGVQDGISSTGFTEFEGDGGVRVGITNDHIAALVRALESVTDITIMANPKILALNKQMGTVFIGQKIGYRDRTTISADGQATVGEVKFMDTGTKLSFRPYIADDGYIRMDIYPKDSSGELDDEGIPTETTAELTTNIMVKDGKTIVIGGLFRDAVTNARTQVPLLGDLPIMGNLFRGTSDTTKRQEIIVMLAPHIVTEPEQTQGDARAEDIARKRYGAKQGLHWAGRARIAEDHYIEAAKYYADGNTPAALEQVKSALQLRPTYLEALRLRDRILTETQPEGPASLERNIVGSIETVDTRKWLRR